MGRRCEGVSVSIKIEFSNLMHKVMIEKFASKRNVLFLGGLLFSSAILSLYLDQHYPLSCKIPSDTGYSIMICENIFAILMPSSAFFLLSIIFSFLDTRRFMSWVYFALCWCSVSMILIAFTPESRGFISIDKLSSAIPLTTLFILASMVFVVIKSVTGSGKRS